MRLSHITQKRANAAIEIDGETLNVSYNPAAWTPEFTTGLDFSSDTASLASTVRLLSRVLLEWDLTGDDGQAYPLTEEALAKLPTQFLTAVVQGMAADMRPDPTTADNSASIS